MVEFELKIDVPMRRDLLDLALDTIAMVWDCHVGRDVRFTVVTVDSVLYRSGAMIDLGAAYDPARRLIAFGLKTLFGRLREDTWQIEVVRVAAHEAMHAVQCAKSDVGDLSKSLPPIGTGARRDSAVEIEANQESVDVLKGYIPNMTGAMPWHGREYPVPTTSRYTEFWKQVRAGHRRYVIVSETGPGGTKPPNSET